MLTSIHISNRTIDYLTHLQPHAQYLKSSSHTFSEIASKYCCCLYCAKRVVFTLNEQTNEWTSVWVHSSQQLVPLFGAFLFYSNDYNSPLAMLFPFKLSNEIVPNSLENFVIFPYRFELAGQPSWINPNAHSIEINECISR